VNPSPGELLAVGEILKPFGIQGDVTVRPMTDFPLRFKKLERAFLGKRPSQVTEVRLERVRVETRGIRLRIVGVGDRTGATQLVGSMLFVDEEHRVRIRRGTYFIHDIVGVTVVDERGDEVGTVGEVLKMPAHDVYVIRGKGPEILLPAVKEFVLALDIRAKTMRVRLIEGMAEK